MLDFEMEYVFCKDKIGECLFVKASTANELLKLRLSSGSNGSFAFRPKYTKSELWAHVLKVANLTAIKIYLWAILS